MMESSLPVGSGAATGELRGHFGHALAQIGSGIQVALARRDIGRGIVGLRHRPQPAADAVVAARATPTGKIRISTSAAFGHEQLLPLLPGLLARYPALTAEVDFDDRIVDLVQAALADLGVAEVGVHHAWRHLQQGELKILLPRSHHPGSYEMSLQYPHRALVAPRVRVAVEYLLERFAAMEELHVPLTALRKYAA
nr:LysR substrate-binding domain-containing protein [Herbaspirillum sp. ASV7]